MPKVPEPKKNTSTSTSHSEQPQWIDDSNPQKALAEVMRGSSLSSRIASAPQLHTNEYPLWQGPCGEGWNGGITQSMIGRFLSCRERFRLKYVLGLEPYDKWNHRLGYGNMWHACEEAHSRNEGAVGIVEALHKHTAEQLRLYPLQAEEIEKWHNVCAVQFPEYVKYWQEHPDVKNRTPLLQEQIFDVPYTLPSGRVVRLRSKLDSVDLIQEESEGLLGRHKEVRSGIWLQENKTKADIDKLQIERQLKFDLQTMVYIITLKEEIRRRQDQQHSSAKWNHNVLGVRYNVVRRPLSGGKGSIKPHVAKQTKTKYTPAETDEQFYERLRKDYLAAEPDYWFFRIRAEITERDIEIFRETCLDPLLETICCWYDTTVRGYDAVAVLQDYPMFVKEESQSYPRPTYPLMNYRTPFGVYSALEEGGSTEYDAFLETGSEAGLRRVQELFPELK